MTLSGLIYGSLSFLAVTVAIILILSTKEIDMLQNYLNDKLERRSEKEAEIQALNAEIDYLQSKIDALSSQSDKSDNPYQE